MNFSSGLLIYIFVHEIQKHTINFIYNYNILQSVIFIYKFIIIIIQVSFLNGDCYSTKHIAIGSSLSALIKHRAALSSPNIFAGSLNDEHFKK